MQADRRNGFGALRLLFASLVIVSHSFEMLDGDRHREPLSALGGGMTLGAVAVTGFFLLSGYLITSSFISDPRGYIWKRVLRIYPAFVACSLICLFIVAPLGQAAALDKPLHHLMRLALLAPPVVDGAYPGMYHHALNGSMWTIAYEFRCYLLAAVLGLGGLYARRSLYAALTVAMLVAATAIPQMPVPVSIATMFGEPHDGLRLAAAFMVGGCFKLFPMKFNGRAAAISTVAMLAALGSPLLAETGAAVFGSYALFWLALNVKWTPLLTINAKDDISYGVYLYAWPAGALLLWYWRDIDPIALMGLTLAAALACGWLSWHLLEKPAMRLKGWRPLSLQRQHVAKSAA